MKLECFFYYIKEISAYGVKGTYETVYIYEYKVHRCGIWTDLILYMVVKANKDGFAKNKDIKKGFYTLGQAKEYAYNTYKLVNQRII